MDQHQDQEEGNIGLSFVLSQKHLSNIKCKEYSVPMFGIDDQIHARTVYYPKKVGLFSDFLLVEFNKVNHDEKLDFSSGPFILSKEPRKKGNLKWSFLNDVVPNPNDLITPFFYSGSGNEDSSVVISMLSQKRFVVPSIYLDSLTKYEKSHSDYLIYRVTFQWLKHIGLDKSILDDLAREKIKNDMWVNSAYKESFD